MKRDQLPDPKATVNRVSAVNEMDASPRPSHTYLSSDTESINF